MLIRVAAEAGDKQALVGNRWFALTNGRVGHNDHNVSVGSEDVDESGEVRVLDFHAVELCGQFGTTQLKLLYYIRHLLEALAKEIGLE